MKTSSNRIIWIDRMRGLVMLTVVMIHLYSASTETKPEELETLMSVLGNFRMPLFFFVSGYIVFHITHINTIRELFSFYKRKVINLFLPTFVWVLLVSPLFFAHEFHLPSIEDFLGCFFDGPLWFLNTLFYFMLSVGIYKLLLCNSTYFKRTAIVSLFIFWILYIVLFKSFGVLKYGCLYYPYFMMGLVTSNYAYIDKAIKSNVAFVCSFFVFCLLSGYWVSGQTSIFNLGVRAISAVSAIVFFYNAIVRISWNEKVDKLICLIGVNTLSIYVAHWYFLREIPLMANWYLATLQLLLYSIVLSLGCVALQCLMALSPTLDLIFYGKIKKSR